MKFSDAKSCYKLSNLANCEHDVLLMDSWTAKHLKICLSMMGYGNAEEKLDWPLSVVSRFPYLVFNCGIANFSKADLVAFKPDAVMKYLATHFYRCEIDYSAGDSWKALKDAPAIYWTAFEALFNLEEKEVLYTRIGPFYWMFYSQHVKSEDMSRIEDKLITYEFLRKFMPREEIDDDEPFDCCIEDLRQLFVKIKGVHNEFQLADVDVIRREYEAGNTNGCMLIERLTGTNTAKPALTDTAKPAPTDEQLKADIIKFSGIIFRGESLKQGFLEKLLEHVYNHDPQMLIPIFDDPCEKKKKLLAALIQISKC